MLNKDDGCIRYLMQEMDPAEVIEFEREMLNDENLLIEVESLRKTYKKFGKLPLYSPPKTLIDQVVQKAISEQQKRTGATKFIYLKSSKAVASISAIIILSVGTFFYGNFINKNTDTISNLNVLQPKEIQPWMDKNEEIQFVGTTQQQQAPSSLDKIVERSFKKLRLVNSDTGFSNPNQTVILTSTKE